MRSFSEIIKIFRYFRDSPRLPKLARHRDQKLKTRSGLLVKELGDIFKEK